MCFKTLQMLSKYDNPLTQYKCLTLLKINTNIEVCLKSIQMFEHKNSINDKIFFFKFEIQLNIIINYNIHFLLTSLSEFMT